MEPQTHSYSAFISHSSKDLERANEICASLEARGFRCFIAPRDLRGGQDYGSEIIRGIEHSRCLVLLLSEAANQSDMVRNEVERAVSKRKPIFPIRIEDVMPSERLEFFISSTHWLDAWTGPLTDHINKLINDISDEGSLREATDRSSRIARRRQIPKWVATVGGFVLLVVAIVVGVRISLIGTTPKPVAGTTANAPPPANPQIIMTPQVPATRPAPQQRPPRNAGAPPAPVDPMEQMKQLALRQGRWFVCDPNGWASFLDLQGFYPVIKRIRFGESADKLDQVIEIPAPPTPVTTREQAARYASQYRLNNIPYRIGAQQIFNQLEFTDGTPSDIRPAMMDPRSHGSDSQTGIRLRPVDSQPAAPIVFAAYPSRAPGRGGENWDANDLANQLVQITPFNPAGTQSVQYATDDDVGFYDAKAVATDFRDFVARTFAVSANHKIVRLRFKSADGKELGTFVYSLDDVKPLIGQAIKSLFVEQLDNMVRCMRVNFEWPLPQAAAVDTVRANAIEFSLESKGLHFIEKAPIIAVVPSTKPVSPFFASVAQWSVVSEIAIGDSPQRLSQTVRVNSVAATPQQLRGAGKPIWQVLLPADTKEVYFQIHYTDGTSSDVRRLEIEDINLPS